MTGMTSQFTSAGKPESNYMKASLNFMVADKRQGLNETAKKDFETIKAHASAHPEARTAAYVAKVEASLSAQPAVKARPSAPKM